MAIIERTYNVPLRREFLKSPRYRRAKKAIIVLKSFISKHMKSEEVFIGKRLNEKIWERGIKSPPHHVSINVIKEEDGKVYAELSGFKYEKPLSEEDLKKLEKESKKGAKKESKAEEKTEAVAKKPAEVKQGEAQIEDEMKKLEEKTEKIKEEKAKKGKDTEKEVEKLSKEMPSKKPSKDLTEAKDKKQAERSPND